MIGNIYTLEHDMFDLAQARQAGGEQRRRGQMARQAGRRVGSHTLLRAGRLIVAWTGR